MPDDEDKQENASGETGSATEGQETSLDKALAEAPPELRSQFKRMISMGMSVSGPMSNPLTEKITPQHIDKILQYTESESQRLDNQEYSERRYTFWGLVVAVVAAIG